MSKYYTLLTKDETSGKWYPQFGDYARQSVVRESREYPNEQTRIIETDADQASIDKRVAEVNSPC